MKPLKAHLPVFCLFSAILILALAIILAPSSRKDPSGLAKKEFESKDLLAENQSVPLSAPEKGAALTGPSKYSNPRDSVEAKKQAWAALLANHPYYTRPAKTPEEWKTVPKQDRPDLAMEQDFLMTMDPSLGRVPFERLRQANEEMALRLLEKSAISGIDWQERGPDNVGGRTRALVFDPNDPTDKKVWAGGVSGGL